MISIISFVIFATAKPPFLPQPPKSQQSDLLLKKLEKQSTHPSRKLKKAGITVASETLAAKSAGLQWGLVQQGSSNLSLPVLERPESRFSSTGRLSRIDTVNDRLALAQRIRQKEIKANHVRQREMQKKLDKAHETIEKGFEVSDINFPTIIYDNSFSLFSKLSFVHMKYG